MAAAARTHLGHFLIGLGSEIRDIGLMLAPGISYSQNGHVSTTAREQTRVSRGPMGAQADPRRR